MAPVVWEKWRIISYFSLSLLIVILTHNCQAVTHWVVTENGRIEAQTNSLFNLQKPFDLVMFIQQEQKLNKVYDLRNELRKEQDILDEVNRLDLSETFFKTDPTCREVQRWHELDLSLNYIISFSSKGINLAHHLDLEGALKTHNVKTPLCLKSIPVTLYSFDHLEGVANRHALPGISEYGLLSTLKYVTDVDDWGDRIARALAKNSTSWILQNMAALYWRIKGNTVQSINCLRQALYYSPREHRDMALFSLALILHHANYSLDAIMLLHTSLELTRDVALHQYVLANIYASLDLFNMTELCLKYVTLVQPAYLPALKKLKVAVCERRYLGALKDQLSSLEKVLSKVDKHKEKQNNLKKLQEMDDIKQKFAYDVFRQQLLRISHEPVAWLETPLSKNREVILNKQVTDQGTNNIQKDVVSTVGNNNNNINSGDAFTVNIQLDRDDPDVHKKVYCQKANPNGDKTQVPCEILDVDENKGKVTRLQLDEKGNIIKAEVEKYEKQTKANNQEINKSKNNRKTDKTINKEQEKLNNSLKSHKNDERSSKSIKDTKQKPKKSKKKHETGERKPQAHKAKPLSLQERTMIQVEHARETVARVRSMLEITPDEESADPFRAEKNSAGPGGTGKELFQREDFKSSKKGESMGSSEDDPTFVRRKIPDNRYRSEHGNYCKSNPKVGKRKGDNLDRGCQNALNDVPHKAQQPKEDGTVENKKNSGKDGSQVTTDTVNSGRTGNKKIENRPKNTPKLEASGKEGVLSSLREFQEALRKSKKEPGQEFDYSKCEESKGNPMDQLSYKSNMLSTVVSIVSKGTEISQFIDFNEELSGLPKPPRCSAKIDPGSKSLSHIKSILRIAQGVSAPESGLKHTLLSHAHFVGKNMDIEEIGTRIHRALKRKPTSFIMLNLASLYWRVTGDAYEAVRCLRLAVQHAPSKSSLDVPLISLESILYRSGFLDDAVLLGREALEVSPNAAIAHFALANTLAAQGHINEATQHFLIVLQLEPGFTPAIERLKIIQCILWNQQKQLEKEADELRKLLAAT